MSPMSGSVSNMADITEAEIKREFKNGSRDGRLPEAVDVEEVESDEQTADGTYDTRSMSLSSDRPSSCGGSRTSSALSELGSEDRVNRGDTAEASGGKEKHKGSSVWQSFKKAGNEFNQDTRRMFHYLGRKLHRRRGHTKVKEIHILPGEDDDPDVGKAHGRKWHQPFQHLFRSLHRHECLDASSRRKELLLIAPCSFNISSLTEFEPWVV